MKHELQSAEKQLTKKLNNSIIHFEGLVFFLATQGFLNTF